VSEEAAALLLLGRLPGVGDRTVLRLRSRFGSGRAALSAPISAFEASAGGAAASSRTDPELRAAVEAGLGRAEEMGTRVVVHGEAGYPGLLYDLVDPPPVLFLRGDPSLLEAPAVTVVGSRRATGYGRRVAATLAGTLARAGVVVASGLAFGVDGAAHRGALSGGGSTFAVLGAGVDHPHPPSNRRLFHRLAQEHLLVSEFLPGEAPRPYHFPKRNRILAALAQAVIVVEAARKSGALITADHALDLGRDVLAVPGPVDRRTSRGTNALLRDGAGVVVDPERLDGVLPWIRDRRAPSGGAPQVGHPPPLLGDDAGRVWEHLSPERPRTADEVARTTALPPGKVLAALSKLETEGWVERRQGMAFLRRGSVPGGETAGEDPASRCRRAPGT